MTKRILVGTVFCAISLAACGVEDEAPIAARSRVSEVNAQSTTWHEEFMDVCTDITGGYHCSSLRPSPQCPEAVHGTPCTPPSGSYYECWQVRSRQYAMMYTCR